MHAFNKTIDSSVALKSLFDFGSRFRLTALLLGFISLSAVGGQPQVIGYGVKECEEYVTVFEGWEQGDESAIMEYLRYRGWLAGLVTGLSLATGSDVLKGVEVKGAMRRIQVYCDDHPDRDFFNASMELIRILDGLAGTEEATGPAASGRPAASAGKAEGTE